MKKSLAGIIAAITTYLISGDYRTAIIIAGVWWLFTIKKINIERKD